MSSNLTALVILVTLIHVAALAVMIVIRVRRTDSPAGQSAKIAPCVVCGEPSTHRSYDGLDPNAQFNPKTGRYWSTDVAHYPPLCDAH